MSRRTLRSPMDTFLCTTHDSKYSNSIGTIVAILYFQFLSNDEIAYISMDSCTDVSFIRVAPEVTADVKKSDGYFLCTTHDSNSIGTIVAILYFQFLSNDEIAYISMDSCTDVSFIRVAPEVTADVKKSDGYFLCTTHDSNSIGTIVAILYFQFLSNDEIAYFSMDSCTDFSE